MNVCGERIRALRESMNYSQMKFAETFGAYAAQKVHADRATWCMTNAETVNRFR